MGVLTEGAPYFLNTKSNELINYVIFASFILTNTSDFRMRLEMVEAINQPDRRLFHGCEDFMFAYAQAAGSGV